MTVWFRCVNYKVPIALESLVFKSHYLSFEIAINTYKNRDDWSGHEFKTIFFIYHFNYELTKFKTL